MSGRVLVEQDPQGTVSHLVRYRLDPQTPRRLRGA